MSDPAGVRTSTKESPTWSSTKSYLTGLPAISISPARSLVGLSTSLAGVSLLFDTCQRRWSTQAKEWLAHWCPSLWPKNCNGCASCISGREVCALRNPVFDAIPGLYTADGGDAGQGAILNQDNSYNSATNPANPGDIIQLFGTRAGQTDPPGLDLSDHDGVPRVSKLALELRSPRTAYNRV